MRTLQSELVEKGLYKEQPKKKSKNKEHKNQTKNKPKIENLSRRQWEKIMGKNMPRFKRHRGAYRQY